MKRGFTLVELAIVLVIIGLLIGGILVAQSMMQAARINSFISQLQQIDAAVTNFQTRYNSLPGDTDKMSPAGDNDGNIEDATSGNGYGLKYSGEVENFWSELSTTGFDSQHSYAAAITGTFNSNTSVLNAPFSALGDKVSILPRTDLGTPPTYTFSSVQNTTNANRSLYPSQGYSGDINGIEYIAILAIDKKLDDGNLTSGKATAFHYSANHNCIITDAKCVIFINIQSQLQ